jgi:hypothetical protein
MDTLIDCYTRAAGPTSEDGLRFHFTSVTTTTANLDFIEAAILKQRGTDGSLATLSPEATKRLLPFYPFSSALLLFKISC